MHVDSVKQRAADAGNIALDLHGIALARPASIAQVAAGTWVHGSHKDETRREGARSQGAGNGHPAFLQPLAQNLQTTAGETAQTTRTNPTPSGDARSHAP